MQSPARWAGAPGPRNCAPPGAFRPSFMAARPNRRTSRSKPRKSEDLIHHSISENLLVDLAVKDDSRPKRLALVQEVQHHPLSGKVLHVDFHEIAENEKVTVRVPVETIGEAEGVKTEGGVLEHVLVQSQGSRPAQGFAGSHHRGCQPSQDRPGHPLGRNQSAAGRRTGRRQTDPGHRRRRPAHGRRGSRRGRRGRRGRSGRSRDDQREEGRRRRRRAAGQRRRKGRRPKGAEKAPAKGAEKGAPGAKGAARQRRREGRPGAPRRKPRRPRRRSNLGGGPAWAGLPTGPAHGEPVSHRGIGQSRRGIRADPAQCGVSGGRAAGRAVAGGLDLREEVQRARGPRRARRPPGAAVPAADVYERQRRSGRRP